LVSFLWATVTDDSPLRIRLDGEASEVPVTPSSLVDPLSLQPDDRVLIEIRDRRLLIHGRAGGVRRRVWDVAAISDLNALDASSGDLAFMSSPGTGITALWWEAFAGSGTGADWRPLGDVIASSATNLTNFIAAVAAVADTTFKVGGRAVVTTSSGRYERFFTSTAGALTAIRYYNGRTIRRRASANLSTGTSVQTLTIGTSIVDSGDFTYSSGVFTVVNAGTYKITLGAEFAGHATGYRTLRLLLNADAVRTKQFTDSTSLGIGLSAGVGAVVLVAGDTLTPQAQQNSGGNLAVVAEIEFERVA
jgi:hypothetical protein